MVTTDIIDGLLAFKYELGGGVASIGITSRWPQKSQKSLFFVSRPFAEKFLSHFGSCLVPTVDHRCCGLLSLPSYGMRRPLMKSFAGLLQILMI